MESQLPTLNEDDPSVHLASYIYKPIDHDRPSKRRRADVDEAQSNPKEPMATLDSTRKQQQQQRVAAGGFTPLLNGAESDTCVKLRFETYDRLWKDVEERTNDALKKVNQDTLSQVSSFVQRASPELYSNRLPTALVLAGPNIASHSSLFTQMANRIEDEDEIGRVVLLTSKDATNLKTVLKRINVEVTEGEMGRDEDVTGNGSAKSRYLNYDPQILCNWSKSRQETKIVIAIQDTEAFDTVILSDLISLLAQFKDRIPLIFLLGIATSEEIFYDKLPKSTIRLMRGERFDVQRFEESMEQVFEETVVTVRSVVKLGPNLCDSLFERLRRHTRSIQSFVTSLKYAYMSHFYANPLTVLLGCVDDEQKMMEILSDEHIEAVRNTLSFRRLVEASLEAKNIKEVKFLLNDDQYLRKFIWQAVQACMRYAEDTSKALNLFQLLLDATSSAQKKEVQRYDLYSRILFGDFIESPLFREVILSVRKLNSESIQNIMIKYLSEIGGVPELEVKIADILYQMRSLAQDKEESQTNNRTRGSSAKNPEVGTSTGLISEFDITNDSMRTTVLSGRVRLDELKKKLTKQDLEYSKLVKDFTESLEIFFEQTIQGIDKIFLNEVFFYDIDNLHSAVFASNIRPATERALSSPYDYLASELCENIATQPATSIVYQLYLNAGSLINIYDLWSAFCSIVGAEDLEDGTEEKEMLQVLFYQSLAELKYLGIIKYSKRKTDHLQKLAWKGL